MSAPPSTDQLLDEAVSSALEVHRGEVATAVKLYRQRMTQSIVDGAIDTMFDTIFTNEQAKARLLPYFAKRTIKQAATAQELAHLHDVVKSNFLPMLNQVDQSVAQLTQGLAETMTGHLEVIVMPALQRAASTIVVADRHAMSERLHQRVEFIQSEALSRVTMIANHEARELNEHITATLLGRRAAAQANAHKTPSHTTVPNQDELTVILAECARRLKPETLQRMSTEECKESLLQSFKREASAWAVVDELQRRLDRQEAGEENRRIKFEEKTRSDAAAAVHRAEAEAASIQSELNKLRMERSEMQDAIIDATALIVRLDARCALLSTKLKSLISSTREFNGGTLPPDFTKAERELLKLSTEDATQRLDSRNTTSGTLSTALSAADDRAEIRAAALSGLKNLKLKSDAATLPRAEVSDHHRVFAENVLEMAALRHRVTEAEAASARADKALRAMHASHVAQIADMKEKTRDQERRYAATLQQALDDKLRIMDIATALHLKLQEATIQVHVAGDEVVDDLVRRLRLLEGAAAGKASAAPPVSESPSTVPPEGQQQEAEGAKPAATAAKASLSRPPSGRPSLTLAKEKAGSDAAASSRPASARSVPPRHFGEELQDEWLQDLHLSKPVLQTSKAIGTSKDGNAAGTSTRPLSAFVPKSRFELGLYQHSDYASPRRPHSAVSPRAQQLKAALLAKGGLVPKPPSMRTY